MKPSEQVTRLLSIMPRSFQARLLFPIALFLLVFIPLYPKIPLADVLPGYIVRLRLEDLFVLVAAGVYVVLWLTHRVNPRKNPLWWLVLGYLGIGFVSGLSAIFITKTIPFELLHIGKWGLHWARRIEYMFLLFLFFDAVTSIAQLKIATILLVVTVSIATLYGFGQKYFQWPVYSTMNREFAKGWRLVLTEHARVPSTFAGHYDLGAYLVITLPLFLALFLFSRGVLRRFAFAGFVFGYLLLILTASRISFIGYFTSLIIVFVLFSFLRSIRFVVSWFIGISIFSMLIFLTFGDLSGRFAQVINLSGVQSFVKAKVFHLKESQPAHYLTISDQLALVADKTDAPPIPFVGRRSSSGSGSPGETITSILPPDVYENIPLPIESSSGGVVSTISTQRNYSDAAFEYGLSSAIRFDALWPRAIEGFKKNIFLGSGYSTLTKTTTEEFTEAESTDNDYLRALGETGALGFVSFYGTIGYAGWLLFQGFRHRSYPDWASALLLAMVGSITGLLVNATYIDVFEASKVAFTFWALLGIGLAVVTKAGTERSTGSTA